MGYCATDPGRSIPAELFIKSSAAIAAVQFFIPFHYQSPPRNAGAASTPAQGRPGQHFHGEKIPCPAKKPPDRPRSPAAKFSGRPEPERSGGWRLTRRRNET